MHTSKKALIVAALFTLPVLAAPQMTWAASSLSDSRETVKEQMPQTETKVENEMPAGQAVQNSKSFTLQRLTVDKEDLTVNAAALEKLTQAYVKKSITMNDLN